jgi:hypothetical protein
VADSSVWFAAWQVGSWPKWKAVCDTYVDRHLAKCEVWLLPQHPQFQSEVIGLSADVFGGADVALGHSMANKG